MKIQQLPKGYDSLTLDSSESPAAPADFKRYAAQKRAVLILSIGRKCCT
jgi:hypothetical protein